MIKFDLPTSTGRLAAQILSDDITIDINKCDFFISCSIVHQHSQEIHVFQRQLTGNGIKLYMQK